MNRDDSDAHLAGVRRARVLAAVSRAGAITVNDLAAEFGVSSMTIRRDINQLAHEGRLVRVHGGAVAVPAPGPAPMRRTEWTIGMVSPSLGHYWTQIALSAQAEAGRRGVGFVLRETKDYYRDSLPLARQLVAGNQLDGIILAPPWQPEFRAPIEDWVLHQAPRTVVVEREVADPRLAGVQSVRSDHARGTAVAVRHLYDLGHRRIALMLPPLSPGRDDVRAGWLTATTTLGLPHLPIFESVHLVDDRRSEHLRSVLAEFTRLEVTAVVVLGDPHALAVVQTARELGLSLPDQLSVVGFDDDLAILGPLQLTSVRPPREALGRVAVTLLLEQLRLGDDHVPQHVRLACSLTVRQSTAPPAARA